MLTIAVSIIALPTASAQTTRYLPNNIYVGPQPLTGVNEQVLVSYFMDRLAVDVGEIAGLVPGELRAAWHGIYIVVTHPDGTNETIQRPETDPVGGGWFYYTPTVVGVYYFTAFFPGEWRNTTTYHTFYSACNSPSAKMVVQQEPIVRWPYVPLPDDYWMRPISGNANTWTVLAGAWLGGAGSTYPVGASGGAITSYGYGASPDSPHILWTRQSFATGDIQDVRFGSVADRYGGYQSVTWSNNVILDGKIYCTVPETEHDSTGAYQVWDLKTGELLYSNMTETQPATGQIYWYDSGNEHGLNAYVWRTSGITLPEIVYCANATRTPSSGFMPYIPLRRDVNFMINRTATPTALVTGTLVQLLDAYTGNTVCYIANASTGGTEVRDKLGARLFYSAVNYGTTAAPNYYLQIWNSSAGTMIASQNSTGAWQWRPSGGSGSGASVSFFGSVASNYVHDGNLMYTLNVSIASILGPRNALLNQTGSIQAVREGEYIIFGDGGRNDERGEVKAFYKCFSLKPGEQGRLLWESTVDPPLGNSLWYNALTYDGINPENNVAVWTDETSLLHPIVMDLQGGGLLWEGNRSIEPQYGFYGFQLLYYKDMIIVAPAHSGVLTAHGARNGSIIWQYIAPAAGTESPYGNDLTRGFTVTDDGKLITSISEHSPSSPLWRSPGLKCFNITTGELQWELPMWASSIKTMDGMLTAFNLYDGQVYCIGKGPSATTVSAPQDVPALGSSVTLTGTVTDQTPTGRRNINNLMAFTLKDTPAISDADMEAWMQYKFQGQGKPVNAKGVNVTLTAIDPNNNFITIGTTTSDITGHYGVVWQPEVPGTYQIIATFAGSNSYYGSSAITYMGVGQAPAAPIEGPQPEPYPPVATYVLYAAIAIIVAVAIVGLLLFRKKP